MPEDQIETPLDTMTIEEQIFAARRPQFLDHDVVRKAGFAEAGAFRLRASFSSAEIVAEAAFDLTETWIDKSPARAALG